ncbi:MAG: hypothetical protein ABI416_03485 [Ginsengibacter sp.]
MSFRSALLMIFSYCVTSHTSVLNAQKNSPANSDEKVRSGHGSLLFENEDILHFRLVGKLNNLFNDRSENMSYHPMLLQYKDKDSSLFSINIMVKTRGHFRRLKQNCKMPPLLLNFSKGEKSKSSLFEMQGKLKLVVPCQGDEYIIKEWLAYKVYNIITDKSFAARLAMVDFEDSLSKRKTESHYCILLEDEDKMAQRNKTFIWKKKMLNMKDIDSDEFKKMAVFQYMIGNTDWGIPYLQNIVLISRDTTKAVYAVPYDFDHSGIVDAPYAGPAEELELSSVRERAYRGYCENDKKAFAKTFDLFNRLKNEIYNVYTGCTLLKPKYVKTVSNYLDDFYETINSSKQTETEFQKPCKTNIRIELKGLKK